MTDMEMAKKLTSLARADLDAASVYGRTMDLVEERVIRERLSEYRQDHLDHFQELAGYIADMGADAPRNSPSRTDFIPRDIGASGPASDIRGLLRLLYQQELNLRQAYREASQWELSLKARALVDDFCSDENKHMRFLEEAMKDLGGGV